jgi:D-sedoheptulose 7-phosphate isomerase
MTDEIGKLISRFPELSEQAENIRKTFSFCVETYAKGGTVFLCGNGGSAADAEHIAGELLKEFKLKRKVDAVTREGLSQQFGEEGKFISDRLQRGLRTIALTGHPAFSTAYANDVEGKLVFAQQLYALGKKNDTLIGLSTSGNSANVLMCLMLAKVMKIKTAAMTGAGGGKCLNIADCCIRAPARETYLVQEYHLPIYHTLCLMIEEHFYGGQ